MVQSRASCIGDGSSVMGPLLSTSKVTIAAARLCLPVRGRPSGRRHHVIRSNRGPILGHVVRLFAASNCPSHGLAQSCVPAAGPSGTSALGAAPNSVTWSDVKGLKLSPVARSCGEPMQACCRRCASDHAACSCPQRKSVSSTHIRCKITASFLATATLARFMPRCLATFRPHALRLEKRWDRVKSALAAS